MKENLFLDTDVILDLLEERKPFWEDAVSIFNLAESGRIKIFTSSLIFSNLFYILRKSTNRQNALKVLRQLKSMVTIVSIGSKTIELALNSDFRDFEDAIQYYGAVESKVNCLITRNIKDYKVKGLPILLPSEYLARQKQNF